MVLLDSGSGFNVCPIPPAPTPWTGEGGGETPVDGEKSITEFATDIQGHRIQLEHKVELVMRTGRFKYAFSAFAASSISTIILSLGLLLDLGATIHLRCQNSDGTHATVCDIGSVCLFGTTIPVIARGNCSWIKVSLDHRHRVSALRDEAKGMVAMMSLEDAGRESPDSPSEADARALVSQESSPASSGQEASGSEVPDVLRLRHTMSGASSSIREFEDLFKQCIAGGTALANWDTKTDSDGYSVLAVSDSINKKVKDKFPDASQYLRRLVAVAVQATHLRFQDYSLREHVLMLWLVEGEQWIRSHGGSVYIYHDEGAFQEYRHAVTPESALGRLKDALLTVEGLFRLIPSDTTRDTVAVMNAILKCTRDDRFKEESELFQCCIQLAVSASPTAPTRKGPP